MQDKPFRLPAPHDEKCEYKDKPCTLQAFWTVWRNAHVVEGHYCKRHSARVLEDLENALSQRS